MKKKATVKRRRVEFRIQAQPQSRVFIAGTFNDWNAQDKELKTTGDDALFSRSLLLPAGKHEYKFIVDGSWQIDPECPHWTSNEHGTLNSVMAVG